MLAHGTQQTGAVHAEAEIRLIRRREAVGGQAMAPPRTSHASRCCAKVSWAKKYVGVRSAQQHGGGAVPHETRAFGLMPIDPHEGRLRTHDQDVPIGFGSEQSVGDMHGQDETETGALNIHARNPVREGADTALQASCVAGNRLMAGGAGVQKQIHIGQPTPASCMAEAMAS